MRYRSLAAFGISLALIGSSARARAADQEDDDAASAKGAKTGEAGTATNARVQDAQEKSDEKSDETSEDDRGSGSTHGESKETPAAAQSDVDAIMAARIEPAKESDGRPPVYGKRGDWIMDL